MIKCKECGHEISSKATTCPNCGVRIKRKPMGCGTGILIIIALIWIASLFNSGSEVDRPTYDDKHTSNNDKSGINQELTDTKQNLSSQIKSSELTDKEKFIEQLEREIKAIDKIEIKKFTESVDMIMMGYVLFSAYCMVIDEGSKYELTDDELKKLNTFKKKVRNAQIKYLPKLRDAYGPATRDVLWEHDMSSRTIGTGYRTIEFVGAVFAANRNIKDFHNEVHSVLYQLRFKQARYKWYKGADEYTYYDIDSPDDSALVIWEDGINCRLIE